MTTDDYQDGSKAIKSGTGEEVGEGESGMGPSSSLKSGVGVNGKTGGGSSKPGSLAPPLIHP